MFGVSLRYIRSFRYNYNLDTLSKLREILSKHDDTDTRKDNFITLVS